LRAPFVQVTGVRRQGARTLTVTFRNGRVITQLWNATFTSAPEPTRAQTLAAVRFSTWF